MSDHKPSVPPRRILVATDLSGRGDRALDRAAQLAGAWNAELVALHAFEDRDWRDPPRLPSWRKPADLRSDIETQLRQDLDGVPSLLVRLVDGPAPAAILNAIDEEGCDLVVVGGGRHRAFGGLGDTLDELFRTSPVSVLVAKQRPRRPYERLLVGTDFTDEALGGFEVAAALFPAATCTLLHAFELPYRSLLSDSDLGRDFQAMERETIRGFVDKATLPQQVRDNVFTLVEHGPPAEMLYRYAADHQTDLTVIGAYERGRLFHTLLGGEGPRILETVASDILVVRPEPEPR